MNPIAPGYPEQLARLEARARYEPRPHSRPAEKLLPLRRLLERLGRPERGPRIVHVAGTNGKGTTAAMTARLLQREGARVGLYTSPHLVDIRERIQVQGLPIGREAFARATAAVLDAAEALLEGGALSYFDLLTAIGFLAFREQGVDWLVLETGLGGSADSTNVTDKALCILTAIGHDHMAVLGGDLRAIAGEKMGIVPPGAPVVLATQPPALADWMASALAARGSEVLPADRIALDGRLGSEAGVSVRWPGSAAMTLPLPGFHISVPQLSSAAAALVALERLAGPARDPRERLARATTALRMALPGRQQVIEGAALAAPPRSPLPRLVLDGAHNREALHALVESLARWRLERYTLLVALMSDKMVEPVREPLAALLRNADRVVAVTLPFSRAPRPEALRAYLASLLPPGAAPAITLADPSQSLALAAQTPGRTAVAAGSLWMVGELLKALRLPEGAPDPLRPAPPADGEPGAAAGDLASATGAP